MMKTTVPSEHQRLGRKAKGFDREKWDERQSRRLRLVHRADCDADKSRIVEEGNYHKFTKADQAERMAKMLLDTGDRELVEVCRALSSFRQTICPRQARVMSVYICLVTDPSIVLASLPSLAEKLLC